MATTRKKKSLSSATTGGSSLAAKRARKSLDLAWVNDDDNDEHIDSEESSDDHASSESESEEENLDVKKVRLARQYLEKLDQHAASDDDSSSSDEDDDNGNYDDADDDVVSRKLQRDRLKRQGVLERPVADKLNRSVTLLQTAIVEKRPAILPAYEQASVWVDKGYVSLLKGHDLTPTCVALGPSMAVSGSKDHSVILWDVETETRVSYLCPHWKRKKNDPITRSAGQVAAVACSDDGRYAAVGKRDASVCIFDIRSNNKTNLIKTLEGHKAAITSLTFRSQSLQLFSASEDRCIRQYNLEDMLYIETLYGHQLGVTDIDCHRKERPVSVSRDRTARAWKLAEDTHLIFRGGSQLPAAESVSLLSDDWFVAGHEDGVLSLWNTDKKRAVSTVPHSHGIDSDCGLGKAVVSVDCVKGSDVVASGSYDGYLRFWKVQTGKTAKEGRGLDALCQIPIHGFINDIAFGPKAKFCIAAVGQEHRCGRWKRVARAKNRIAIIKLQPELSIDDAESENEEDDREADDYAPKKSSDDDDDDDESE